MLQRRFFNRKIKVINISCIITVKISCSYHIEDVNALTEESTSLQNVPVSNTQICQWRVAITSLSKHLNRALFVF